MTPFCSALLGFVFGSTESFAGAEACTREQRAIHVSVYVPLASTIPLAQRLEQLVTRIVHVRTVRQA